MHRFERTHSPKALDDFKAFKRSEGFELADVSWDSLDGFTKTAIQEELVRMQGGLCAYCGGRIRPNAMRIEHWAAQSTHGDKRFEWSNLFGVCLGTNGAARWCDVHRGDVELKTKPDRDQVDKLFVFTVDKRAESIRISSTSEEAHQDADVTLNLNVDVLRANRYRELALFKAKLGRRGPGPAKKAFLLGLKQRDRSGDFIPYLPALLPTIETYLRRIG